MSIIVVISNPNSGKRLNNKPFELRDLLNNEGVEHQFLLTEINCNAFELVMKLESQPKALIVSGGDGTISEVIQGMHAKRYDCPILIVPAGTSNELAGNFNFTNSIASIKDRITNPKTKSIDYGLINESTTFAYSLSFGTFTELTYKTPQKLKNIFGFFAYVMYGFFTFRKINSQRFEINYDGGNISGDFTFGGVSNSKSLGNIIDLSSQTPLLDDGVFEVMLIRTPESPKSYRKILSGLRSKDYSSDLFIHFKTSKIQFLSEEMVNWNIDGENGGDFKELKVENCKQSLKILI